MKAEFICANHRQWLLERPTEARNWWEKSFDAGKYYQEMKLWEESVRPLGCAFDAATICIEQKRVIDSEAIDRFSRTAQCLVYSLDRFSRTAQCLVYSLLKIGQHGFARRIVSGIQHFVKSLESQVFDRQKMLDMQRKLHLFLAAHPAVEQVDSKSQVLGTQSHVSGNAVVSIH